MNNSFSRMNRDTRRKIAIGAGLLALLLICGIAGFRFFSGKTQSAAKPNGPTTGIAYDQNAEEGEWVAYTQAAGFNSATIFSTNNLRQSVEGLTDYLCTREEKYFRKFAFYGATLLCFHLGVALGWWCVQRWGIPSVLACLPLLGGGLAVTVLDERTK